MSGAGKKPKTELLSPAGSPEIFRQVLFAGADAVYFGGESFGARAYASNFSMEEAAEAISLAHIYGKKAYLTVNTLLKNTEIERALFSYLKDYQNAGLDAVIVQDFGVLSLVRDCFPALSVHASTQMNVTGAYGAAFLKAHGVRRVVTARELSLDEIRNIHDQVKIEIETFVHGALCVSYSGQCLMSSMIGGRSGNRGRCAQPCRLPYELLDEKGRAAAEKNGKGFLLSPKDLCGLFDLSEMITAGVYSFKIEGRMKQARYAAGVTAVYREALDRLSDGEALGEKTLQSMTERLISLGARNGFTDLYFHEKNGPDMMSFTSSSHTHEEAEKALLFDERKLPVQGAFTAKSGEPLALRVSFLDRTREEDIIVTGDVPQMAKTIGTTEEEVKKQLTKTGGTPYSFSSLSVTLEEGLFLPVKSVKELRRRALLVLSERLCRGDGEDDALGSAGRPVLPLPQVVLRRAPDDAAVPDALTAAPDAPDFSEAPDAAEMPFFVTVTKRPQLRAVLSAPSDVSIAAVAVPYTLCIDAAGAWHPEKVANEIKERKKRACLMLPPVFRQQAASLLLPRFQDLSRAFDLFLAGSYDALQFLKAQGVKEARILLDSRLYTWSDRAKAAFQRDGYQQMTVPFELNEKELSHRNLTGDLLTVYGYTPLMLTANCPKKNAFGCDKTPALLFLKDRKKMCFPVENTCTFCYNTVYNSLPLSLLSETAAIRRLHPAMLRLDFTVENGDETKEVLRTLTVKEHTKGHFKRGVE